MTTGEGNKEITFVLQARDQTNAQFQKLNAETKRTLELWQNLGMVAALFNRQSLWLIRHIRELTKVKQGWMFATKGVLAVLTKFGVISLGVGTGLGLIVTGIGGLLKSLGAANAAIELGSTRWQTLHTAMNRTRIQLAAIGLTTSDTSMVMSNLNKSVGRLIATSILQSAEAMGLAARAGNDLNASIAKLAELASLTGFADHERFFVATQKALQGDREMLDLLAGSLDVVGAKTMSVQQLIETLAKTMQEVHRKQGEGLLAEHQRLLDKLVELDSRMNERWEKWGLQWKNWWLRNWQIPMEESKLRLQEFFLHDIPQFFVRPHFGGRFLEELFPSSEEWQVEMEFQTKWYKELGKRIMESFALLAEALKSDLGALGTALRAALRGVEDDLNSWLNNTLFPAIGEALSKLQRSIGSFEWWKGTFQSITDAFYSWAQESFPNIGRYWDNFWDDIGGYLGWWRRFLAGIWDGFTNWFSGFASGIGERWSGLWERIGSVVWWLDMLKGFKSAIVEAISWAVEKFQGFIDWLVGLIPSWVRRMFGGQEPAPISPSPMPTPNFGVGGIVPGPIGKPVLAIVHGGEEVRRRGAGASTIVIPLTIGSDFLGDLVVDIINREVRWKGGLLPGTVGA